MRIFWAAAAAALLVCGAARAEGPHLIRLCRPSMPMPWMSVPAALLRSPMSMTERSTL